MLGAACLPACLLLLTNLRGKIGIQLVWPEELSLFLIFFIQSFGPSLTCSLAVLHILCLFSSPFSPYLSQNFLITAAAANPTQRGELNSISQALGALSCLLFILASLHSI